MTNLYPLVTPTLASSTLMGTGHWSHSELVYSRHNVGLAEMFQRSTPELADYFRLWPLSSCGQQLGTGDGQHTSS